MELFLFLLAGLFGAMIGSFLNVVIYRYGASTIHKGRSICLSCGEKIKARDLIPIVSFIFLGGKCRYCKTRISAQYIYVEIISTALALLAYLQVKDSESLLYIFSHTIYYTSVFGILICIFLYDLKHKIIPDEFSFTLAALALLGLFFTETALIIPSLSALLAGPLLALPCAALFYVSGGKWMGLGDAKLFLGVGWLLGISLGLSAFILSFWIGAIVSLIIMRTSKGNFGMGSQVPFAPFIIVATILVYFTQIDVLGISLLM
jgi:leader peptidase (prepilin peptidase)/N-methyltransferase